MRAFVTGVTGLLGSNLADLLVARGHEVRGLVRSPEKAARRFPAGTVEPVRGDLDDVAAWAGRLAGCDALFHCAAYFREYYRPGDHWPLLERRNVLATVEILRAAERAGVARALHVSSSGVIGPAPGGRPSDETTPPGDLSERNLYFRSKLLAEEAIARLRQASGLPVVIVAPGWMFGPGDSAPTDSGRLVLDYYARKVRVGVAARTQPTDARDVAAAMLTAGEGAGRDGVRYLLAAEPPIGFMSVLRTLGELTGVPPPRIAVPAAVARAAAALAERIARMAGRRPPLSRAALDTLVLSPVVTSAKARTELGATFRPLRETLSDELAWFSANGYLSRRSGDDRG
jgi:dihydroflavonol-4-reductase